jgi:hypothetical protein
MKILQRQKSRSEMQRKDYEVVKEERVDLP